LDVTNSNAYPFRIKPGAPTNSLTVTGTGVGIGTWSPSAKLDVVGTAKVSGDATFSGNMSLVTDTDEKLIIQNTSATTADREMLTLENNGVSQISLSNTAMSSNWKISNAYDWLIFQKDDNGYAGLSMTGDGTTRISNAAASYLFDLDSSGNLAITGSLTAAGTNYPSDRSLKENLEEVDPQQILNALSNIPISTWNYLDNSPSIHHMGAMAQDFYAAFELGVDNRHISPLDTAGVSFAAIQALNQKLLEKEIEIAEVRDENSELSKRLEKLELIVQSLIDSNQ
jgi:hypothetical protein